MSVPACHVGHVGLRLGNILYYTRFFQHVFGMQVTRISGDPEHPDSVWLDGGIQLMDESTDIPTCGSMHHLCIIVPDVGQTLERARPYGAVPVEGKGAHWFTLAGGPLFELKTP